MKQRDLLAYVLVMFVCPGERSQHGMVVLHCINLSLLLRQSCGTMMRSQVMRGFINEKLGPKLPLCVSRPPRPCLLTVGFGVPCHPC